METSVDHEEFKCFDETTAINFSSFPSTLTLPQGLPKDPCDVDSKVRFIKTETASPQRDSSDADQNPGLSKEPCEADSKAWFVKTKATWPVRETTEVDQDPAGPELECEQSFKMFIKKEVTSPQHEGEHEEESPPVTMNDMVDRLITAVGARPGLWDSRLPLEARDKFIQATLWLEVAYEIGGVLSVEELKKTFKSLRDRYMTELINDKLPSGSGTVKRKTWVYLRKMDFLNETVAHTTTYYPPKSRPLVASPPFPLAVRVTKRIGRSLVAKKKKRSDGDGVYQGLIKEIQRIGDKMLTPTPTTPEDIFCSYLAEMLKRMTPEASLQTQIEIMGVIRRCMAEQREKN